MIDHTGMGVADMIRSASFYDACLAPLGLVRLEEMRGSNTLDGVGYGATYPVFWIDRFHPHSVRQHTAFRALSRAAVDAFHAAALTVGGTDNGGPGQRTAGYYAAFVFDPDGNNIEAVYRGE